MSRCLPFPPPGFVWKVSGGFLTELLKLRSVGAQAEKKKKSGDKRRKRKQTEEAGEKRKHEQKGHSAHKRHKHQRARLHGAKPCSEASAVTEEHKKQPFSHCRSTSVTAAAPMKGEDEAALESEVSQGSESQLESTVRNLIGNWVPPSVQTEYHDLGDQQWLFESVLTGKRRSLNEPESIIDDLDNRNINASARYLPDAGIYALPYAVAF